MIELYHISKQYQVPRWALTDITLHVKKGDFFFITGPSGSGKTTLLKLIFREILPTHGQIIIDNRNILRIPDHRIYQIRRSMGIVFQDFRLLFQKRVFENVAVVLQVLGVARKEIRRRVFNALRMVNLHHKMWEYPAQLSPTGNLDPELANEIMTLFKEVNRQGATVIICTHDRELIRHFGEKIFFLYKGKLIRKEKL